MSVGEIADALPRSIAELRRGCPRAEIEKFSLRSLRKNQRPRESDRPRGRKAQPRDIVLIAGKGHEAYQQFADHTIPFDDIQVARRAIEDHPVEF